MDVKHYVAQSVAEGLVAVKNELGPDAVILSVKEHKDPQTGARLKVDILASPPRAQRPAQKPAVPGAKPQPSPEALLAELYEADPPAPRVKPILSQGPTGAQKAANPRYQAPQNAQTAAIHKAALAQARAEARAQVAAARQEPALPPLNLRNELGRILPGPPAGGVVADLFFYLLDTGIDREIAEEMIERLSRHIDPRRGWPKEKVRAFLCTLIEREVACAGSFRGLRKPRIAAMIGPTGVGKTTTIAKIATRLTKNRHTVGLITLDQFRVGAFDQLKKFATALNVPLLAATNKADFQAALRVFRSRQVVLIDTTGQNPRDLDVLDRLNDTLHTVDGLEKHLVLSAPTKERDLVGFVELYRKIGFHYMIFSKLDETATYGGLLNAYFAADRPFSYFSMGQRVPEDLVEASADQLNDLLFQ